MTRIVYTGSMTQRSPFFPDADGEGIVIWRWDEGAGEMTRIRAIVDAPNPSWLALDAANGRLHATSELHDSTDGRVVTFAVDAASGDLHLNAGHECGGSATCHLAVSPDGQYRAWANYGTLPQGSTNDASIVLCRTASTRPCRVGIHAGKTPWTTGRQERPHAHCVLFDPPNNRVLSTDLGLDALFATTLDMDDKAAPQRIFDFPPGSGPRHIAMHPDLPVLYVVHELMPRIDVLCAKAGSFELCQSVQIGKRDVAQPAGLVLSADARHLFASVRGTNTIVGFELREDGRLAPNARIISTGRTPRDLSFTADGQMLLVACQDSAEIWAYQRSVETGELGEGAVIARTGSPTCVTSFETSKESASWPT